MAIKFNYNQTVNQAKRLEELAGDMQSQSIKQLEKVYENVNAAWTGQAAKTYLKYIHGIQGDLTKKAKYLCELASFLRESAKKMQAADAAAKQLAQKI